MSGNSSTSRASSSSNSGPLSAGDVNSYWRTLNKDSGGRLNTFATQGTQPVNYSGVSSPQQYFSTDLSYKPQTADLTYHPVSDTQIKALGGAGATRGYEATRARKQAIDEIAADSGLTLAQRQRSTQLTDQDYADRQDAIAKEAEAALTGAALTQAQSDQSGRQAQAGFDADQWIREFQGRQAQAQQNQQLAGFLQSEAGQKYQAAAQNAGLTREDMLALAQIYFGGKGQTSSSTSTQKSSSSGGGIDGGAGAAATLLTA